MNRSPRSSRRARQSKLGRCAAGTALVAGSLLLAMGCNQYNPPPWWDIKQVPEEDKTDGDDDSYGYGDGDEDAITAVGVDSDDAKTCAKDPSECPEGCAWSLGTGTPAREMSISMDLDCGDNIILAGDFPISVDFGAGMLTEPNQFGGNDDIYVAKLDPHGKNLWSRSFGKGGDQICRDVAVDSTGAILLTGFHEGTLDFGGGPLKNEGMAAYVAKLDGAGNHLWSRTLATGDESVMDSRAIAVDPSGNVWLTGSIDGGVDLGGGPLSKEGFASTFLLKLDKKGKHLYSRRFESNHSSGDDIIVDPQGNAVIQGTYDGVVDFGGGPLPEGEFSRPATFVARFDASGKHMFSKSFPATIYDSVHFRIGVDSAGNTILAGMLEGQWDLGGGPIGDGFNTHFFIVKYDPNGNLLWIDAFEEDYLNSISFDISISSIVVDKAGHIVLAGSVFGSLPLSEDVTLTGGFEGERDSFLLELDSEGVVLSAKAFGGSGSAYASDVKLASSGATVWAGSFDGVLNFGQGPIDSHGDDDDDLFVASVPR